MPKGYLKAVVGAAKRQVESKRVEEEVAKLVRKALTGRKLQASQNMI